MRIRPNLSFIALGFFTILVLMGLLSFIALTALETNTARTETVVQSYNQKINLVNRMHTAARERILSLYKMLLMSDPFEADREYVNFNAKGTEFVVARNEMLGLELSPDERSMLAEQQDITLGLGPIQNRIADLILSGDWGAANEMLIEEALPLQREAFTIFNRFRDLQLQAASATLAEAYTDYDRSYGRIIMVTILLVAIGAVIAVLVIRHTRDTQARLRRERQRALLTLHSIGDGVITTDRRGQVDQINEVAQRLTEYDEETDALIDTIFTVASESDHAPVASPVREVLNSGRSFTSAGDSLLVRKDGVGLAIEYTVAPIRDDDQRMIGAILVFRDVTEMRALSRQLTYHASHDPLTGLHNRREFESTLEQTLAHVRRRTDTQHWLCYIDLDQFKVVNDTCGHIAGDELLKQISFILKQSVRDSDLVARMGGDEFAILLKNCDLEQAYVTVDRLRRDIHELRFSWDNKSFTVGASIGVVAVDADSGNVTDLFSASDTACFVAKEEGRNRIHVYKSDDDATSKREGEMEMVHRINKALQEDRFRLYAQEIFPLHGKQTGLHFELLVRMLDEEGRVLSPMAFIPAAERYNLMSQIDRWVVTATLRQFQDPSAILPEGSRLSINLSAQSLTDDEFQAFLLRSLEAPLVDATYLCFEITETAAIANLSRAVGFIQQLREAGCRISLDDFGSGLSSFGYLKNMPVDYLKIDGGFIQDILDDPMDRAFVESINQIGHVIGVKTIAEFVDDEEKLHLLRTIGVDYGQGYHLHRPQALEEVLARYNSKRA